MSTMSLEDTLRETARLEVLLTSCIGNYERLHLECVDTAHEEAPPDLCDLNQMKKSDEDEFVNLNALQLKIQEQVDFGLKRRSKEYIQYVFSNHCEPAVSGKENSILKKNFSKALQDLEIKLNDQETEELFKCVDVDRNNSLSYSEFEKVVFQPSDLERWALSIPFHYVVADAVSCIEREGAHKLEKASNLTESDIVVVCNGIVDGMKKLITGKVFELKQAFDRMRASQAENQAGSKYLVISSMSCGGPEDFHKGLEGRIGTKGFKYPTYAYFLLLEFEFLILAGTPHLKFLEAMEAEHCKKPGHNHLIETPNYKIKTCPETEWKLVVHRDGNTPEQYKEILSKNFPSVGLGPAHHGRRIPDLEELLQLEESKQANLIKCEVLAIVLYTGPLVCFPA